MRWIGGDTYLGLFMAVTDDQLRRIAADKLYFKDTDFLTACDKDPGNNAYFVRFISNKEPGLIYRCMIKTLKLYDSVSWWNEENTQFFIRRRA